MPTLKVVLTGFWFDKIEAGLKKHEYRIFSKYWIKRITFNDPVEVISSYVNSSVKIEDIIASLCFKPYDFIEFQRAYPKNPKRMTFWIEKLSALNSGIDSDLRCIEPVFDIEMGDRLK